MEMIVFIKKRENIMIAHSGGVTPVLNTCAATIIASSRVQSPDVKIYAAKHGLQGLSQGMIYDCQSITPEQIKCLAQTPSSVFGSCRHKAPHIFENKTFYQKMFVHFQYLGIKTLFYQGGNDSQDTSSKIQEAADELGFDLQCIGLPKTIDNDLVGTDFSPGFPSVAQYLMTSILEASLDLKAMASDSKSTRVFICEVMGRHSGWLAASTGLINQHYPGSIDHILVPEVPLDIQTWLKDCQELVLNKGHAVIVVAEGVTLHGHDNSNQDNQFSDSFGHKQMGGIGQTLASLVKSELGFKTHHANLDYCQRSAGHLRSHTDVTTSKILGVEAISASNQGKRGVMLGFQRHQDNETTHWSVSQTSLATCALHEKKLPQDFYLPQTYSITESALSYFNPLVSKQASPTYQTGLPHYLTSNDIGPAVNLVTILKNPKTLPFEVEKY
jgi:6-phosphofructokinase 1